MKKLSNLIQSLEAKVPQLNVEIATKELEMIKNSQGGKINWDKLDEAWKELWDLDFYEITGLSGSSLIRKIRDDKYNKYTGSYTHLITKMLAKYPDDFVDKKAAIQEALTTYLYYLNIFYATPTAWMKANNGKKDDKADLIMGGLILKGLESIIPNQGGYITLKVKTSVMNMMQNDDILSPHYRDIIKKINSYIDDRMKQGAGYPTEQDIADYLDVSLDKAKEYLALAELKQTMYDDNIDYARGVDHGVKTKSGQGSNPNLMDIFTDPEMMNILADELYKSSKIIKDLPFEERVVLELIIMEELDNDQVSYMLGISDNELLARLESGMEKVKPKLKSLLQN